MFHDMHIFFIRDLMFLRSYLKKHWIELKYIPAIHNKNQNRLINSSSLQSKEPINIQYMIIVSS